MATPPIPSPAPPTVATGPLDELDRCLTESLGLAQNFAERMRLSRMQVLVSQLREQIGVSG